MRIYRLENESVIKTLRMLVCKLEWQVIVIIQLVCETAETMTPLQSHGYLNNGRSIHPVNYLKLTAQLVGPGAVLINSNNRIVGVYAASYGTPYM